MGSKSAGGPTTFQAKFIQRGRAMALPAISWVYGVDRTSPLAWAGATVPERGWNGCMRDIMDVKGASGALYRFTRCREGNPLSAMGGNFIYAREEGDGVAMIYAGEAQNLLTDARSHWDRAVRDHGAMGLYTRLNISEGVRLRELEDITAAAVLPMSAD